MMSINNPHPVLKVTLTDKVSIFTPLINPYWPKALANTSEAFTLFRLLPVDATLYVDRRSNCHQSGSAKLPNSANCHWPKALVSPHE